MPEYERSLNTFIFCLYIRWVTATWEGYKCSLTCTTSVSLSPLEAGVKKKKVCQEPGTEAKQRCSVPDDSFQDHFCLHSYYRQYPALPILSIKFYLSILYFANHTVLSTTAVFDWLKNFLSPSVETLPSLVSFVDWLNNGWEVWIGPTVLFTTTKSKQKTSRHVHSGRGPPWFLMRNWPCFEMRWPASF